METSCVLCRGKASIRDSIQHGCGHYAHTLCLHKTGREIDYGRCDSCHGHVDLSQPLLPEVEPVPEDGRDYILDPLTDSEFHSARKKDGVFLRLRKGPLQCPIDMLIREGYGLQHMLKEGTTIDDYLQNGYGWNDLTMYQDLDLPDSKARGRQALFALGMRADHLLDYKQALPIDLVRTELEIEPRHLSELYDLTCPEGCIRLSTSATDDITAKDALYLGYSMDDLIRHAGMEYLEQYLALEPTNEDERALQATKQHVTSLKRLDEPERIEDVTRHSGAPREAPHVREALPMSQHESAARERYAAQFQNAFQQAYGAHDVAPPVMPVRRTIHGFRK